MNEQPYINTMDIFPLETPEQNKLHRFYDLLREGRLTTTKCTRCDEISWPPRTICPSCLSDELEWIDLPKKGKLFTYTVQFAGVSPAFEVPLYLGMVQLDNGLKIFARLVDATEEDLTFDREVELTVIELPGVPTPQVPNPPNRVLHAFKPTRNPS